MTTKATLRKRPLRARGPIALAVLASILTAGLALASPINNPFLWFHYCNISHGGTSGTGEVMAEVAAETCTSGGNACDSSIRIETPRGTIVSIASHSVRQGNDGRWFASTQCANGNAVSCFGDTVAISDYTGVSCLNGGVGGTTTTHNC